MKDKIKQLKRDLKNVNKRLSNNQDRIDINTKVLAENFKEKENLTLEKDKILDEIYKEAVT